MMTKTKREGPHLAIGEMRPLRSLGSESLHGIVGASPPYAQVRALESGPGPEVQGNDLSGPMDALGPEVPIAGEMSPVPFLENSHSLAGDSLGNILVMIFPSPVR
ncbi:hypothetical protein FHS42_006750 [Streptomyces zagrosensis]|uniref:Uncharacterized protein n=1 Tax=Streptomyces zagrosensis TaxID=1042984 RepID=A0A7W9QGM7_9ACTN|nr:hypothetical protein [Streptomyces zagrosensis]